MVSGLGFVGSQHATPLTWKALALTADRQWAASSSHSSDAAAGSAAKLGVAVSALALAAGGTAARRRLPLGPLGRQGARARGCRRGAVQRRAAAFNAAAWRRGFFDAEELADSFYFLEGVEGLPADLRGTYYRNGPGQFAVAGTSLRHQLDGDGLVLAVGFGEDGQVCVRHRLVQTQGLLRDVAESRLVTNGYFGSKATGGLPFDLKNLQRKNPANAGVLYWEDRLLALWPYGPPHEVDPGILGTVLGSEDSGATNLGGMLNGNLSFSARPRVCAMTGNLVNFGQEPSALDTKLSFYEWPPNSWKLTEGTAPRACAVAGFNIFADFAVTPRWYILSKPPVKVVDAVGAALGKTAPEVLGHDDGATGELLFVSRERGQGRQTQAVSVPADGLAIEDFANAFELEDGRVVLDVIASERWDMGRLEPNSERPLWETEDPASAPKRRLLRYEVDLASKAFTKRELSDRHMGCVSVNPAFNGKRHRYVFGTVAHGPGAGPWAGVAKVDTETGAMDSWVPGPAEFGGEPQFVPRAGGSEDEGYLITVVFDGEAARSDVVILDAKQVSKGPVCRFALQTPMPHGLHTCWAEGVTFNIDEMKRKRVLLRMFRKKMQEWADLRFGFSIFSSNVFFQKQGVRMR